MKSASIRNRAIALMTVGFIGSSVFVAPISAEAQGRRQKASDHRQETKNNWRNIAIGSGGVALLGLLKKDNTLTFAGAAGALYSLNRYEQDRKSQSKIDHARSDYFRKGSFVRDGHRYERRTVNKGGKKYYQFVRK